MGKPNLAPIRPLLDEAAHDRLMTMNNWPCSEGLRALPFNVQAASTVLQPNNDGLLLPLRAEDGRRIRRQMAVVDLVQRLQRFTVRP